MGARVTSHEVARLAGVSQPTVSRALRNAPGVSSPTRARVLEAARRLSYIPSDSARALSTRRTRRIAVVAEELTNPFYPELVEPLRARLATEGYHTVLVTDRSPYPVSVEALTDGSYDGVILCTVGRRSALPRGLSAQKVPHVLVNRMLDVPESSGCCFANAAGAGTVATLLADLGHTRIGAVHGPSEFSTGVQRATGLQAALRRRRLYVPRERVRRVPFTYEDGRRAARDLLQRPEPPTALACGNDVLAIGALAAAAELGLRVPEDLTVVGFDDIPMASWGMIGLTTVRCDRQAMASASVDLLLAALIGSPARQVTLPVSLVHRATHAVPAG